MANEWQPVPNLLNEPAPPQPGVLAPPYNDKKVELTHHTDAVRSPLEVYQRARDMIAHGWVQGYEAVDAKGNWVAPESEQADKWCVIGSWKGALHYEPDTIDHKYLYKYMETLWNTANLKYMITMDHPNPPQLNDSHETAHEFIVKCFDKVIAHLTRHPESNAWHPRTKR